MQKQSKLKRIDQMADWRIAPRVAEHWYFSPERNRVVCRLCPRNCTLHDGQVGYCGVRRNSGQVLYTDNYGKSVAPAEEVIETEAIYHYQPGARILCLGNIGCMMSCKFCQNWETSQVRYLNPGVVKELSPEEVVALAVEKGIGVISWTYNDPVVWHEFVMETSRLAQAQGIKTLYKSALYIEAEPLAELLQVIDLFSISLKSLDPEFYRRIARGRLQPVLDRIQEIHRSDRHLEISQLIVTGLNDNEKHIRETVQWHLDHLDPSVPLHFVGFHPAFRYLDVERTPLSILVRAREIALQMGVDHVYLGNVFDDDFSNTLCKSCGQVLVERFGLTANITGINEDGCCSQCGAPSPIILATGVDAPARDDVLVEVTGDREKEFHWTSEYNSVHLEVPGFVDEVVNVEVYHAGSDRPRCFRLGRNLGRAIVSRGRANEDRITIRWSGTADLRILPVLDRAHFPVDIEQER